MAENRELINAEGSDNPMTIRELEERMKDFLQKCSAGMRTQMQMYYIAPATHLRR